MKSQLKKFDVVLVDFGNDVVGSEQGGIRPAVIIQNDKGNFFSDTTIVLPITSKIKKVHQPTHTLLSKGCGLMVDSMVLGECICQISECRIKKILGAIVDEKEKQSVNNALLANFV